MNELLSVQQLSCGYGSHMVFREVSFTIGPGQVLCLLGPNGCGKTTLLDAILGLNRPRAGTILLQGKPASQLRRHELARIAAFVPQLHQVSFPYTVRQVVLMGRAAYTSVFGAPSPQDDAACDAALERVGLLPYGDTPYHQLSGGELKLVLLARAIGQQAPLLLMDEPTAHLDFRNELLFLETVVSLCREEGIALLMSTHSPDHAFFLAEHGLPVTAALFAQGTIRYLGPPEEVITPDTIRDVYGVAARISLEPGEDGRPSRRVSLSHTI